LVSDVRAHREPAAAACERGELTAAGAHVDQPRARLAHAIERREPIEQRAEQTRAFGAHPLRREQRRILGLVRVAKLDRGRHRHGE
jgi:hypothetical protein